MGKIITLQQIPKIIKQTTLKKQTIVLTGGCFDVIHSAHIEFLQKSKAQGDILIVILESDASVKLKKGAARPLNSQENRAKILTHIHSVDYVIPIPLFKSDKEYFELVKKLKPDIIAVTDNDPIKNKKFEQAKLIGGKVVQVMNRKVEKSTTKVIQNLLDLV